MTPSCINGSQRQKAAYTWLNNTTNSPDLKQCLQLLDHFHPGGLQASQQLEAHIFMQGEFTTPQKSEGSKVSARNHCWMKIAAISWQESYKICSWWRAASTWLPTSQIQVLGDSRQIPKAFYSASGQSCGLLSHDSCLRSLRLGSHQSRGLQTF